MENVVPQTDSVVFSAASKKYFLNQWCYTSNEFKYSAATHTQQLVKGQIIHLTATVDAASQSAARHLKVWLKYCELTLKVKMYQHLADSHFPAC